MDAPTCKICGAKHWGMCPSFAVELGGGVESETRGLQVGQGCNDVQRSSTALQGEIHPLAGVTPSPSDASIVMVPRSAVQPASEHIAPLIDFDRPKSVEAWQQYFIDLAGK